MQYKHFFFSHRNEFFVVTIESLDCIKILYKYLDFLHYYEFTYNLMIKNEILYCYNSNNWREPNLFPTHQA